MTSSYLVRLAQILENLLGEIFGLAVGRCTVARGMLLGHGQELWLTVDGGTGAVHELEDIVVGHRLQQDIGAGHVVVVVLQRYAAGLTHGLQGGKVGHHVDFVLKGM